MKIDTGLRTTGFAEVARLARLAEELGFDSVASAETSHDPFLPLAVAAEHTTRVELRTSIAIAFSRSPMQFAYVANDLHVESGGRFVLGLGSQIKPHIEKRYSMPFDPPLGRMREVIEALRAIWSSWNDGTRLEYRGKYYQHTLMTPFFSPEPNPYGMPKIFLAAVGPKMTSMTGELADGILLHGFTTPRYVAEVTMPAIEEGLRKAGRDRSSFEVCTPSFLVTGRTQEEYDAAARKVRGQISFYGSTPAYRGVLELHGWGDLQTELNTLSKQGRWDDMADLITDEILETFAICGEPDEIGERLVGFYKGIADRVSLSAPYDKDPETWGAVMAKVRELSAAPAA